MLLNRAVYDKERGMGSYDAVTGRRRRWSSWRILPGGDARKALNAVELAVLTTERSADGKIHITLEVASGVHPEAGGAATIRPGTTTTTRSLPLSRVCGAPIRMPRSTIWPGCSMPGRSIKFIARRIMICASEDVGNADPQAIDGGGGGSPGRGAGGHA